MTISTGDAMANTLYDILEVSPTASSETIDASFKRLKNAYSPAAANGDEDATNRLIALKEAFTTLSDPARRRRYDDSLAVRVSTSDEASSGSGGILRWILVLLLVGAAIFGYQRHRTEQERLRLQAEQSAAALRLAEIEAQRAEEAALQQQEERRRRDQLQAEAIERYERERAMSDGRQVSSELERSEQRERQQQMLAERQRQIEAERQLARDKAYLRQLEAENRRRTYY